ncbi:MAG: hypothetical protein M0Q12_07550 [Synergistaceae bacterium]|jgi:hypothetical protein|nr:hypothetical protein [Synergistaceae bacterium]
MRKEMKKVIYFLSVFTLLTFTSCMEELDNWESETFEYSGRFDFKLMSEDMSETIVDHDGYEMQIYNTVDNVENVVWLDDHGDIFPLKCIFELTGNASSFKSSTVDFSQLKNNIYSTDELPSPSPTASGQTVDVEEQWYIRAAILDGKIIPGAATTPGGNKADSLYIKIKLFSGTATYESFEVAESVWQDPEIPEFKWKFKSAVHDPDLDETYVVAGYRYTGYPED